jgi:hypothetical protein
MSWFQTNPQTMPGSRLPYRPFDGTRPACCVGQGGYLYAGCHELRPARAGIAQQTQKGELQNTPEALDAWAAELHTRFGGRPIAVCLERLRGAVVYQLAKYPHLILYPVHPTTSARLREAFYPCGAKSDSEDTDMLLDLLEHHRDRLRCLDPDTPATRLLQMLVVERRAWVDEKTRQSNRLTGWLKIYFRRFWIGSMLSIPPWGAICWSVGPRWNNCSRRIQAIYQATPAIRDAAMLEARPAIVKEVIALIRSLRTSLEDLE